MQTDGVSGVFGIREAFEKLLEGTALNVTEEDGSVLIGLPGNLRSNRFDRGRSAARDRPTPLAAGVFNTGVQNFGYDDSAITPVAGLVFRPSRRYSVYANYIEGLDRGDVAPLQVGGNPIANAGEVFAPFKSKQVELGTKYDRGNFGGTLAVFRINKPNSIVVGDLYRPDGEQRNQGVELSWYGEPLAGLRALGGATWMDAEAVRTQGGSNDGNPILGVPDFLANVGFEWDVPALESLTLDARAVYTSDQTLNATASVVLPSWTRIDVGARHSWLLGDSRLTLRARIDNLTGRDYWASAGGFPGANYLVLAAPRTFTVSVSVDFL